MHGCVRACAPVGTESSRVAEPSSRFMLDRKGAQERSSSTHGFERACAHVGTETSTIAAQGHAWLSARVNQHLDIERRYFSLV